MSPSPRILRCSRIDGLFAVQVWAVKNSISLMMGKRTQMRKSTCACAAAACMAMMAPFISGAASASGMDASKSIVCAVVDVVGCTETGACMEGTARGFDLPEFLIVDAQKSAVQAAYEAGHKDVSSPVKSSQKSGDHLIVQGVENGRGWDIAINTKSGRMSASGVGDEVSFLLFGACTSL